MGTFSTNVIFDEMSRRPGCHQSLIEGVTGHFGNEIASSTVILGNN